MPASFGITLNKDKFTDPHWYTSLAVNLLDLKWGGVAKELSKALKPADETVAEQLAKVFVGAFNQALTHMGDDSTEIDNHKDYSKLFLTGAIDPDFPSHHPLFSILLDQYKEIYRKANLAELELIELNNLKGEFSASFKRYVSMWEYRYPAASDFLNRLRQFKPSEAQVLEGINEALFEVEHGPLAIEQRMTLLQSYVSPACKFGFGKDSDKEMQSHKCLVSKLVRLVESSADPIIIHGQPGHGKTSSVKMLFRTLCGLYKEVTAPPIPLLFEFKYLHDLNRSAVDVLQDHAKFIKSEDFFFGRNTIVILDGLDERQAAEGGSDDFLKNFVRDLFNLAKKVNRDENSRLNLVLTGRSQYVGQIKSAFTGDYNLVEIQDFDMSQQQIWLNRFNKQTEQGLKYQQFEDYKLNDLVGQPILLAVSALMLSDKEGKALLSAYEGKPLNRAMIYQTIIEWSYQKNWHKEKYQESWKDDISFGDYFTLLQAIAFVMHQEGKETIRLSDLTKALKDNAQQIFQLDCIGDKWLQNLEGLLKQLRISFFFTGVEDKAFSFIHKSIKDFLFASGLVDASKTLFEDFKPKRPEKSDEDLVALFGANALSVEDHCGFLSQWLVIRKEQLDECTKPAYLLARRVIEGEFSINHISVAQEQSRTFAIVTHNLLQLVSRWFCLPGVKSPGSNNDGTFCLFDGSELESVMQFLKYHGLKLNVFDKQNILIFELFGTGFNYSFNDCKIHMMLVNGLVGSVSFVNAQVEYLHINSGAVKNCDFSGSSKICLIKPDYHATVFYKCDFSKRRIEISERYSVTIEKTKFINCNLEGVTFEPADAVEIIEDMGFQPLNLNIQ